MPEISDHRRIIETKIIKACSKRFLSLGDLAEILLMNKHTLRARYIYPLVKAGKLVRYPGPPAKSTVKYKRAG